MSADGPGPISGVGGPRRPQPVRDTRREKPPRKQPPEEEKEKDDAQEEEGPRKGRFIDERC